MKNTKSAVGVLLLLLAVIGLAACGGSGGDGAGTSDGSTNGEGAAKEYRIGVAMPALSEPYFSELHHGIEVAAERNHVKVEFAFQPGGLPNPSEEVPIVNDLLTKQVEAIIVTDGLETTKPALEKAINEGVPVIFVDGDLSGISSSETTVVATDNKAAGEMAGKYIAKVLGGKGKVALLDVSPSIPVVYFRTDEAAKILEKEGVEVVARESTECILSKGVTGTENFLTSDPDVELIYSGCGPPIIGASTIVGREGKEGQIKLVGFDANEEEIALIKEGKMLATIAQKPVEEGYKALGKAVEALETGEVPEDETIGTAVITKANADTALGHQIPPEE